MNSELKNQIIKFILDNRNEFQLFNATVKQFNHHIFDAKGNYIEKGMEVYNCITEQMEFQLKTLPDMNKIHNVLTDKILKDTISKINILAQYKANGLTISRVYKVDTSKVIKIGDEGQPGYNYIDFVTGESVNMCATMGTLLDLVANGYTEISPIESLYLIK